MRFLPDPGLRETDSQIILDAKDKVLLREFSRDARQSIAQLARNSKLSRDTVVYRLSQYKEKKLLFDARMLVDVSALGYDSYHIFLRLTNPQKQTQANSDFIKKLCAHANVRAVLRFYGRFDLEIAVVSKSIQEFDVILLELLAIVQPYLQEYEVVAITQNIVARSFPSSFISQKLQVSPMKVKPRQPADLDKTDFAIIREMRDYADRPLVVVAQKVGISTDVLVYRLRKLETSVVLGYAPVINYGAIGYNITAVLCAVSAMTSQKQNMISELLRESSHILWAVKVFGRYNLLFYICAKTQQEYHETINKLRDVLGDELRGIESLSAVAEYKYTLVPDCLVSDENNKKTKKI